MDQIVQYFKAHGGYARMKDLKTRSFHTRDIARMYKQGVIEKVKPGLYKLAELGASTDSDATIAEVCHAVPHGIICLTSAISYYELATYNPSEVLVAIPDDSKPPKLDYPPAKFYYFRDRFYNPGIVKSKTAHGVIRIYNREKTVCDMFRYRNKLGLDLALEGLRNYLKLKEANITKLRKYAEICQVKTVMIPYVRALVG